MDSNYSVGCFSPRIVRILALITLWFFSASSAGQAAHSFNPPAHSPASTQSTQLDQARLVSALAGAGKIRLAEPISLTPLTVSSGASPVIIHIQDAHANYSAQKNIAQVIEKITGEFRKAAAVSGRPLDTLQIGIAVEGFEGAPDLSGISKLPKSEIRRRAADFFMKQALITGAEYELFAVGSKSHYFGVDAKEFLKRDVALYLAVLQESQKVESLLQEIASKIVQSEQKLKNQNLRLFYTRRREAERDKEKYLDYLQFLFREDHRSPHSVSPLDNILRLHSQIDSVKLDAEIRRAGSGWRKLTPLSLLFYPHLRKQLRYEMEMNSLDLDEWTRELPALEARLKQKLIKSRAEQDFDAVSGGFSLIRKLVALEMSSQEWREWEFTHNEVLTSFRGWVENQASWENLVRVIELAEAFYLIARHRDSRMVENLLAEIKERKLDLCFLIAGGFHSQGLEENLALAGQRSFVASPSIESLPDNDKELYRLRLNGNSKVLANTVWQRYLAAGDQVIPAFVQMVNAAPKSGIGSGFTSPAQLISGQNDGIDQNAFEQSFSKLTAGVPTFDHELAQAESLDAANRLVAYLKQNGYSPRAILQLTQSPLVTAAASRMEASEGIVWAIQNREQILLEAEASEKSTGRSEVRAIAQVELRDNDPSVIDYMKTAYDQFHRFVADPNFRAGKKMIIVLGHTRPDVDSVFSSVSRAYLKHLEIIHSGNNDTVVIPIVNTLNAEERADLEKFRGDVVYYLKEVMQFDLKSVLFYNDVVGDLQGLDPSVIEIYLTDHNTLVKKQKGLSHLVREIVDHHDLGKLSQIKDQYPKAEILIERMGSSATLVTGLISNPHVMRPDAAKLLLAGLISDTSNLTEEEKVEAKDKQVAETLRQRAGGTLVMDTISDQMDTRYDDIAGLSGAEVLRKDPKKFEVEVGGKKKGYFIASLRIGKNKEAAFKQQELDIVNALKAQAEQNDEVTLLNAGFRDEFPGGDVTKESHQARLYISAPNVEMARYLADHLVTSIQGLQDAKRRDLPPNVIQLTYKDKVISRKILTPVIDSFVRVVMWMPSEKEYYEARAESADGSKVFARPVIPYSDYVELVLKHERKEEGVFRNYKVLEGPEKKRRKISYAEKDPLDYKEVEEIVKNSQTGAEALKNGEVMIMRPFGGTGGRVFGYKIPMKYRIRGLYVPVLKIWAGRFVSAWEIVLAHVRNLKRTYGGNVGFMSATNQESHKIFEENLRNWYHYGLDPNHVFIHPVAGIPSLNPSIEQDLKMLTEDDKQKIRKSVRDYFKEIKKPSNQLLLDAMAKKLNFPVVSGTPLAEIEKWDEKKKDNDEIIFNFIAKVNGGEGGLFTYANGALRYKNPSHMTVLSNAFADGALYKAWTQKFKVLVYGNDTDLGHVVDPTLLTYLYERKKETTRNGEVGVQMLALLVSKDIEFTFKNDKGKDQLVTARKEKIVPDPSHPNQYEFKYEIVPAATKPDLIYQIVTTDEELKPGTYGLYFKFEDDADKLTVKKKSDDGQIQVVVAENNIKVKPEKGGVPINIDGKDVLGEAWALPASIKQNEIPTYNPASYLIFIEDVFKAFGVSNPDEFPEIKKDPAKLDQLLHEFNQKINLYWEVKEDADLNEAYWLFTKEGRKAELVLNEDKQIIRSNLNEFGFGAEGDIELVFADRVIDKDTRSVLVGVKNREGEDLFSENEIKAYRPPRFALQPAQLLGDLSFILNTEFINIDRDGAKTPVGYGVVKDKEGPDKYKKLVAKVQNGRLDILDHPTQGENSTKSLEIEVTEEMAPSPEEIEKYIKERVEDRVNRSEVRKKHVGYVNQDQVGTAIRQVFSEMGLSQEPIALVYDHRLPTKAEVESVRALRHVTISIRWDLSQFPDVISRQNELQKAGLENFASDPSFRGRFFVNLTQDEALGSMIQSQTWRAGNRRTVVLTNRQEGPRELYLILTAEKIKQPVAAALLLALVDGNLEDLPPELRIFVTQGANRYGFREDMNVDMILNQLLIEQKTVKRSA